MLVLLKHLEHEVFPKVELVGGINDDWDAIELDCDFASNEVEGVDVALVDHLGRVEKHVLLVAEGLHDEKKEFANEGSPLEELRINHEADYLLDCTVHDAVPTVLTQTTLCQYINTVRNYKISLLSKVGNS